MKVVVVFGDKANVDMAMVQDRELRLIGTLMYQGNDYLKAIELINQKKTRLRSLITNNFPFKEYLKAYEYIDTNWDHVMKVMISVQE